MGSYVTCVSVISMKQTFATKPNLNVMVNTTLTINRNQNAACDNVLVPLLEMSMEPE